MLYVPVYSCVIRRDFANIGVVCSPADAFIDYITAPHLAGIGNYFGWENISDVKYIGSAPYEDEDEFFNYFTDKVLRIKAGDIEFKRLSPGYQSALKKAFPNGASSVTTTIAAMKNRYKEAHANPSILPPGEAPKPYEYVSTSVALEMRKTLVAEPANNETLSLSNKASTSKG